MEEILLILFNCFQRIEIEEIPSNSPFSSYHHINTKPDKDKKNTDQYVS